MNAKIKELEGKEREKEISNVQKGNKYPFQWPLEGGSMKSGSYKLRLRFTGRFPTGGSAKEWDEFKKEAKEVVLKKKQAKADKEAANDAANDIDDTTDTTME